MTELHLIRHADAGDPAAWEGADEARPLSPKGEKQADRLGTGVGTDPTRSNNCSTLRISAISEP